MEPYYRIEELTQHHDRASFFCGEPSLDAYIKQQARQDIKRDLAVCYVLIQNSPMIIGYYTLSASSVQLSTLPQDVAKTSGRYQHIPVIPSPFI